MIAYLYDGTKIGLFTCIFETFYEKTTPEILTDSEIQMGFLDTVFKIDSDKEKAKRVESCLHEKVKTPFVLKDVELAFRSGEKIKHIVIFNYLKTVIENKKIDVSKNFSNPHVLAFRDLLRRITYEIHRFKGFLRFEETKNGFYYAHYSPDNDITKYLMRHFSARLNKLPFIIHDVSRNVLGLYDGNKSRVFCAGENQITIFLSDDEITFKKLWQTYYKSVAISSRKNYKLMRSFLPVRYWKNLPEKQDKSSDF